MKYATGLTSFAVTILLSGAALAFNQTDANDCSSYGAKPDLRIEACTRILAETDIPTKTRALAYIKRGEAYIMKRDNERALSEYEQGIKLDPDNWEGYNGRGTIHSKFGRSESAIADYNTATRLNPTHPWPWINRCEAYIILDRPSLAINECTKSIELQTSPIGFQLRGIAYLKMGNFSLAIDDFNEAVRQFPKYATALYARGIAKQKNSDGAGGDADIAAARAISADVGKTLEKFKVK